MNDEPQPDTPKRTYACQSLTACRTEVVTRYFLAVRSWPPYARPDPQRPRTV